MGEEKDSKKKKKKKERGSLPTHLEDQRQYLTCGPDLNYHVATATAANMYMPLGYDNSWDFRDFTDNFQITINRLEDDVMEFDLIGVDPAVANALRRILIAEVPTVCIEHVFVVENTSIIQDEVLAHRLGLVPMKIDPHEIEMKTPEEGANEKNTVVFKLKVACKREGGAMVNDKVLSGSLHWLPDGSEMPDETSCRFASGQHHMFSGKAPEPVHQDILLAKLRPGQVIELEAHCVKSIGKDHAKFSPVATAWYRLLPEVKLLGPVNDEMAAELMQLAPGLFEHVDDGRGRRQLKVNDARGCEMHLEKLRRLLEQEQWQDVLQIRKKKDHFIFTIESTGVLPAEQLLVEALDILINKCEKLVQKL